MNLLPPKSDEPPTTATDEEYDEEKESLIPSDTYDGLICAACVAGHPVLKEKAGSEGWMIVEPKEGGGFEIVGRSKWSDEADAKTDIVSNGEKQDEGNVGQGATEHQSTSTKRPAEDQAEEGNHIIKKPRTELSSSITDLEVVSSTLKGNGDIFLAYGQREKLQKELTVSFGPAHLEG